MGGIKLVAGLRFIRHYSAPQGSLIQELTQRGLISQISQPKNKLIQYLDAGTKIKLYCGVDPTARSIHLGNLVPMMVLLHFYIRGHDIINIIGGATGQVGDPSGRTTARDEMIQQERIQNVNNIGSQLRRFFENGKEYYLRKQDTAVNSTSQIGTHSIRNNLDWWKDVKMLDFLAKYGKHIRVQQMLSRDSITSRLSPAVSNFTDGLGFNEFTYQILQAYDFYHLYSEEHVSVQVGGNDQWGNIVAGIDLIQRLTTQRGTTLMKQPFGITVPLLTTANGTKFGKSAGNAIFIDPCMNTPFDLFQFFYNTLDEDVGKFLSIFTLLSQEEISSICLNHSQDPSLHLGQTVLAKEVTELVHGPQEAQDAEYLSNLLFRDTNAPMMIDETKLIQMLSHAGILHRGNKDCDLITLLAEVTKVSRKEARRKLEQGSVSLGLQRGNVITRNLAPTEWSSQPLIANSLLILRLGKQKVYPILLE